MSKTKNQKLGDLFREKKGSLLRYVHARLSDGPSRDAEDLLQDVIAGMLSSGDLDAVTELSSYLFRSISNRITDLYRKKDREVSLDQIAADDGASDHVFADANYNLHNEMERDELREAIFSAIEELTPEQKAVWVATELEGYSFQELAVQWDEPIGTLLARKSRASKKLRELLADVHSEAVAYQ